MIRWREKVCDRDCRASETTGSKSKGRFRRVNGCAGSTWKQNVGLLEKFAVPLMGAGVSLQRSKWAWDVSEFLRQHHSLVWDYTVKTGHTTSESRRTFVSLPKCSGKDYWWSVKFQQATLALDKYLVSSEVVKANQACTKIRGQESDTLLQSLSICPYPHSWIQAWCFIIIRFPSLCERPFLKHQELHKQGFLQYWMSIHPILPCPHLPHSHFTRQACKCQHTWHGLGGWQTRSVTLPLQPQRNITRIHGNNVQNLNSQNVSWTLQTIIQIHN